MKKDENSSELARLSDRGHFQINARDEIIKAIENGVPRSVFTKQYGVCRSTLSSWMRDHGSPEYQAKRQGKHLSKVEKETILRLIQQGQLTTHQARKTYGIGGDVLARWLQTAARKKSRPCHPFPRCDEKKTCRTIRFTRSRKIGIGKSARGSAIEDPRTQYAYRCC